MSPWFAATTTGTMNDMDRRTLADFLRARRAAVRPDHPGPRRRTPGLRREEVAQRAGMSADYYTRLEQARGPRPSRQVLTALARALRLTRSERVHLFALVDLAADTPDGPPQDVPTGIVQLIDRLDDTPAFVIDAVHTLLAWNRMAVALLCDPLIWPPDDRNLIWQLFGNPVTDHDDPQVDAHARQCLADLRRAAARYPDSPAVTGLIARLRGTGDGFVRRWDGYPVDPPRVTSTKRIPHPVVGDLDLDCQTLDLTDRDQRLILYTAVPGSTSHRALRRLSASCAAPRR
ncbi:MULTISPECIES: helix-turn-helix transcriptional regulator [Catenuloplanes]|uniref:Transcriptional regulator with XRE-family HTH domain n=1 Tax=Catenuloplanes niger TaxID=587534 RepID=A0AAE3ZM30_9ACTN|nr:helix-turn-helix transcriptional regulator [Catenuloplanes niger]MDR7322413.1 transcriptional regulator with XRE-family HTH domain [Catenuloplanes niger]